MRKLKKLSLIIILLALPSVADAPLNGIDIANDFASAYREWGQMYEHRDPRIVNVREQRAFKEMVDKFESLRKFIKREYSE